MTELSAFIWRQVPQLAVAKFHSIWPDVSAIWEKQADVTERVVELAQVLPPLAVAGIPKRASPMIGMLAGGMAGAGLGYGAGWLADQFLSDAWDKRRLRRALTWAGAGLGAAVPAGMGIWNSLHGRKFNDMSLYQRGYDAAEANDIMEGIRMQQEHSKQLPLHTGAPDLLTTPDSNMAKIAFADTGLIGAFNPDEFNEMLWSDPRITGRVPVPTLAATSGLVTGAANLPDKSNSSLVTPFDIARLSAGMGSGYASGFIVGKTLGALVGLPDSTQELLKNTGMYAGILKTVVPKAFGG